jgi:methylmalonyl-CoA mutase cobalamin-binding domain/chain
MGDAQVSRIQQSGCLEEADVVALALKALSVLASRRGNPPKRSRDERVKDLCAAAVHRDESRLHGVVAQMVSAGISTTDVAEDYVALAARKLGEAWVDDSLSFSDVTIGAARLQEIVRSLGNTIAGGSVTVPLGHRILLVIPAEEDHTLGAFVAANQFRRYGLWVHLAIGQSPEEVAETVAAQEFEMIGISAAGRRALESVSNLVRTVKLRCPNCAPVVVGGNMCNLDNRVLDLTGADFVTTSPRQAIGFCGLTARQDLRFEGERASQQQ